MDLESDLRRLRDASAPAAGAQARVKKMVMARTDMPAMLAEAKKTLAPGAHAKRAVWRRIEERIANPAAAGALDLVRQLLSPTVQQKRVIRLSLMERLLPQRQPAGHSFLKWGAAFAVFALVIRLSPALFLTPRTIADSAVLVLPTRGEGRMGVDGQWQGIAADTTLRQPASFETGDSEMTILLNDDGSIRMDADTEIDLDDISDRPENGLDPTITLRKGRIWVQGFVPSHLRAVTVAAPGGKIAIHEGSMSVETDGRTTTVRVWDRHASVNEGRVDEAILVADEWTRLRAGAAFAVERSSPQDAASPWVEQNLARDSAHRREIAQRQAERRAARAGILPNSPLYAVKRAAEKVDMLLTFDEQSLVQKQLDQATRRVDEAVALIAAGETGATVASLREYRDTLLAVANDTGSSLAAASLIRQQVSENAALLSAARPDDSVYAVKVAVLEASTELPEASTDVNEADVSATLISDSIDTINEAVESGDVEKAAQVYEDLKTEIEALEGDDTLEPAIKKDVLAALEEAEESLQEGVTQVADAGDSASSAASSSSSSAARRGASEPEEKLLTPAERNDLAVGGFNQIFRFSQARPQINAVRYWMNQIEKEYPTQAQQIIAQLHRILPRSEANASLSQAIREKLQDLRVK